MKLVFYVKKTPRFTDSNKFYLFNSDIKQMWLDGMAVAFVSL